MTSLYVKFWALGGKYFDFNWPSLYKILGSPGGLDSKESACNTGGLGSNPGLGRFPGEGHGNPLQCSCKNPHGQWSLVDCSP